MKNKLLKVQNDIKSLKTCIESSTTTLRAAERKTSTEIDTVEEIVDEFHKNKLYGGSNFKSAGLVKKFVCEDNKCEVIFLDLFN